MAKMTPMMRICQDLAEGNKHALLDRDTLQVKDVIPTTSTLGDFIIGFGHLGDSAAHRYAIDVGGVLYDAQDVVAAVLAEYETFFAKHGLL